LATEQRTCERNAVRYMWRHAGVFYNIDPSTGKRMKKKR
jgi:hypothetical protein